MAHSRSLGTMLAIVLVACGGGAASTSSTFAGNTATTVAQETTDSPTADGTDPVGLEVSVQRADDHAVTTLINAGTGGVIEVDGPDGAHYVLSIPVGALLADTLITMTPLDSVAGDFIDGLVGGVDLAPGGLELRTTATLEIIPTRQVPLAAQVPFGYEGDDTRLASGFIQPDPNRILLWIVGFSGAGVLESTTARMEMNRRLSTAEAAYRDSVAQGIGDILVEHRASGGDDLAAVLPQIQAIIDRYIDVMRQRMDYVEHHAADGNPGDLEYFQTVAGDVVGLLRQGEMLGLDLGEFPTEATAWLRTVLQAVATATYTRCIDEHDFTVIPIVLGLVRQLELLGDSAQSLAEIQRCVAFEVRIESEVEYAGEDIVLITFPTTAQGAVPAAGNGQEPTVLVLEYPDAYLYPEYDDPEACVIVPIGVGLGSLEASSFAFVWSQDYEKKRVRPDGRWTPPDDVLLLYDLEEPPTTWHATGSTQNCTADPSFTFEYPSRLSGAWDELHASDRTDGAPRWTASEWEMVFDGEIVARRTYERAVRFVWCLEEETCFPEFDVTERTTFTLVHAPDG